MQFSSFFSLRKLSLYIYIPLGNRKSSTARQMNSTFNIIWPLLLFLILLHVTSSKAQEVGNAHINQILQHYLTNNVFSSSFNFFGLIYVLEVFSFCRLQDRDKYLFYDYIKSRQVIHN